MADNLPPLQCLRAWTLLDHSEPTWPVWGWLYLFWAIYGWPTCQPFRVRGPWGHTINRIRSFSVLTGRDFSCWLYIQFSFLKLHCIGWTLLGWVSTYSDVRRIQWPNECHSHYNCPQFTVFITLQCIRKRRLTHPFTSKHFWPSCIATVVAWVLNCLCTSAPETNEKYGEFRSVLSSNETPYPHITILGSTRNQPGRFLPGIYTGTFNLSLRSVSTIPAELWGWNTKHLYICLMHADVFCTNV